MTRPLRDRRQRATMAVLAATAACFIQCERPSPPAAPPPPIVSEPRDAESPRADASVAVIETGDAAAPSVPPAPPPAPAPAPAPRASGGKVIDGGGVGDVRVGAPIPRDYLADAKDARARYDIRWVADAQPFEAFRVGDPPVLAVFDGPFTRWAKNNVGELAPQRFVESALRVARNGAPVRWIVVEEAGHATVAGIGVGSTFADVAAAYPGAKVSQLPEWFEARPTCSVAPPGLANVQLLLATCGKEGNGRVARVVVSR